jgi:phosphatidylglycerophosphate synthase
MYLDDKLADIFVNKTEIFKNIHPNVFSSISIILNIFIFNILNGWNPSVLNIAIIIGIRCMTDILDGAIARKYNKVSVLGGTLDTIGDISLLCIVIWFIMKWIGMHYSIYIIFLCLVAGLIVTYDLYHDHSAAKIYNDNIINNCVAFSVNNTVVFFTILFGIILYKSKIAENMAVNTATKN